MKMRDKKMKMIIPSMIPLLIITVGCIWLQVFLSKRENKWAGLVLPIICFTYSLIMVIPNAAFSGMTGWNNFCLIFTFLFILNIPTLIFMTIYFVCRKKIK